MQAEVLSPPKRKISSMILKNHNIVTVEEHHLGKWLLVKIHIVKENGSTLSASTRKIYHKSGIVCNAKNLGIKLETQYPEASSLIRTPAAQFDIYIIFLAIFKYSIINSIIWSPPTNSKCDDSAAKHGRSYFIKHFQLGAFRLDANQDLAL